MIESARLFALGDLQNGAGPDRLLAQRRPTLAHLLELEPAAGATTALAS